MVELLIMPFLYMHSDSWSCLMTFQDHLSFSGSEDVDLNFTDMFI